MFALLMILGHTSEEFLSLQVSGQGHTPIEFQFIYIQRMTIERKCTSSSIIVLKIDLFRSFSEYKIYKINLISNIAKLTKVRKLKLEN